MARKRGGLAGLWDRNKKWLKPVGTLAAGALTGGVGGAVVGGLMNGLDREGKGGIGFDAKRGALGAVAGYGMGKVGGALKGGIMGRLGGASVPNIGTLNAKSMITGGTGITKDAIAQNAPSMMSRLGSTLSDGKTLAALGQTAVGAAGAMNDNRQFKFAENERARRELLEDEERRRREAVDPMRAQVMAMIMQRLGGMPQGQMGGQA